jgi:hypothetical protein
LGGGGSGGIGGLGAGGGPGQGSGGFGMSEDSPDSEKVVLAVIRDPVTALI